MAGPFDRILEWTARRMGIFEVTGPIVVKDGSAWLRLAPDEPPQWFRSEEQARNYHSSVYYSN